jgi:hypothetical protein
MLILCLILNIIDICDKPTSYLIKSVSYNILSTDIIILVIKVVGCLEFHHTARNNIIYKNANI